MIRPACPALLLAFALVSVGCDTRSPDDPPPRAHERSGKVTLTKEQADAAKLSITSVAERDVGDTVNTSGKVAFDDLRVAHVFSPITGRVTKIVAQAGERVKKGAPLAVIDSPDLGQAYADLGKAQADLVAAEHELSRQTELIDAHAAPQRNLEQAEDNHRRARAELERAKQKARMLRSDSVDKVTQEYVLKAPIDGEVIARNVNPAIEISGQYSNGNAQELFTIGELDRVVVFADLFDQDLARVKPGSKVWVKVPAYRERIFEGTVEWVASALDPVTRTARVRCRLENADHALKPEMYATVHIAGLAKRATAIPRTAVLRLGDQTVVFVATGEDLDGAVRFERRLVAVDEEEGTEYVPVLKGLEAGEQVVASGAILLSEMT
jgi:membrane fusion protein, heavy metal efflux system